MKNAGKSFQTQGRCYWVRVLGIHTPPKFNSSPLKNGGWKTSLSHWVSVTFQGRTVELREGIPSAIPRSSSSSVRSLISLASLELWRLGKS